MASYIEITKQSGGMTFPLDHEKYFVLIPEPHISDEDYVPPQTKVNCERDLHVIILEEKSV